MNCPFAISVKMKAAWDLKLFVVESLHSLGLSHRSRAMVARQLWLYGAVEPTSGAHFFYEFSHLDTACFQRFIDLFAAAFPDSLNLLQLDQASCHTPTTLVWPDNVFHLSTCSQS